MSGPRTTANGQIVKSDKGEPPSLKKMLVGMTGEIARALPKHVNPDRMLRIALTALNTTPDLHKCTPASFLGSIIQCSQLGLETNTPLGHAYLIPFKTGNVTTCQLIIGYQGMIDLARRSGLVKSLYAFPVHEGDEFSWELGLNPNIIHKPSPNPRADAKLTHVYAVSKLDGGEPVFQVLPRFEVEKYRNRSRAKNGPWTTDYEAMALKTAVRRLFRWLPKSAEMARATEVDEAAESGRNQLGATDPEIIGLLQSQGIEVDTNEAPIETEAAATGEPPHDPQTGEVFDQPPAKRERQPGED